MQVQEKFEKMFGGAKKAKNDSSSSLQRFLDIRRDPSSRFKHLRLVIESLSESSERKLFLEHHSFEAYHLFHELMWQVESVSSQFPGARLAVQELECALWLLEAIFCYLPELVSQRWQYAGISLAMKQLLHPQNFLGIRRLAVRLFLQWYQILGVGTQGYHELDAYFGSLVPHLPLSGGGTTEEYLTELCEQSSIGRHPLNRRATISDASPSTAVAFSTRKPSPFASPPSGDKNAPQNASKSVLAQSFMEKMLEFISADVTKILWSGNRVEMHRRCLRFLMEKLKRYYVSLCVVDAASLQFDVFRPKLSSSSPNSGHEEIIISAVSIDDPLTACRHALIRWVAVYAFSHKKQTDTMNNSNQAEASFGTPKDGLPQSPSPRGTEAKIPPNFEFIRDCLFGSKPMVNFVFTMFRESFLLPLNYASTMGRVFKTLREWLLTEERPSFFNEPSTNLTEPFAGLQCAYMSIIYVLSSFFNNSNLYKDEERATLIVQISAKILALFKYIACNSSQLAQETWQYLLKSLLDIIKRNVPLSPPVTSTDCGQTSVVQRLSGHLFQSLLIAWVYAGLYRCVCNEMWDGLLDMLSGRTAWPELIAEWGQVLESVTRALGVGVFNVDILDLPLERLSEQKMIRRQGASRGQQEGQNVTNSSVGSNTQGEPGLTVAKPMYDFVQGSPVSNGPAAQPGSAQSTHRNSDVSVSGVAGVSSQGPVQAKMSIAGSTSRPVANSSGHQLQSPEELSLDGSSSWDSSGPTVSSNDCDNHEEGGVKESLLENELLLTTTAGEDCDDSVSEEFADARCTTDECDTENVDEEAVVADGGPATIYVVWKRILGCLGDINKIQKPILHLCCLQSLEQLTANLFKIKDNQNVDVSNQHHVIPPTIVPNQLVISSWLFESLHLSERYHESKIFALRLLCRIMINHHRVAPPIDQSLMAQFQAVLHDSLMSGVEEMAGTILTECGAKLFTRTGYGSTLLLCDFVRGAALLLQSDTLPKSDRIGAVKFLSSIVCVPSGLVNECPCMDGDWNMKKVHGDMVRKEITQLLVQIAKSNVERDIKLETLKGLGVSMTDRLINHNGSEDCLEVILGLLSVAGPDIGLSICCTLQSIRELLINSEKKASLVHQIVDGLALALEFTLRDMIQSKYVHVHQEPYAVRLTLDLIDWCVLLSQGQLFQPGKGSFWKLMELCCLALSTKKDEIRRSAAVVPKLLLTFLLSKFNQGGNTQSSLKETNDEQANLLVNSRKNTLVSIHQGKGPDRLLFRHGGGRRRWDMINARSRSVDVDESVRMDAKELETSSQRSRGEFDSWLLSTLNEGTYQNITKVLVKDQVEMRDGKDSLDRLMRHLNTTSPECFANQLILEQPINDYCFTMTVNEDVVSAAINQLQLKAKQANTMNSIIIAKKNTDFSGYKFLLGSGGLVNWDNHCRMSIGTLENGSERAQRELKHLDGLLLKEAHKVAVIYVGDGQEDKQSILSNHRGSSAFEDFVSALGWEVDLKTHCGYAGGLSADVHSTCTYYSTATTEIVFHISTRLPADDPTKNLRHLGNDEVHIVWSEHWRDYRRSIIATEFCDVLIVIYPLENIPFYRIQIDKKPEIGDFGPLTDGMLVSWPILPTLVRWTAINASRAKRINSSNYTNFYEHRLDCLNQAIEKLRAQSSYGNLLCTVLKNAGGQGHKTLART